MCTPGRSQSKYSNMPFPTQITSTDCTYHHKTPLSHIVGGTVVYTVNETILKLAQLVGTELAI